MKKLFKLTKPQALQFAAFAVAVARYMGMGGLAIGHNIFDVWVWFAVFEIVSWAAMAILEGFALPYMSRGARRLDRFSFEWWQIQSYRWLLLIAIPLLGAPMYAAVRAGVGIDEVLYTWQYWGWLLLFSGLVALIVDGVGIVEATEDEQRPSAAPAARTIPEAARAAWAATWLDSWAATHGREPIPPEMVYHFGRQSGIELDEAAADQYILEWRAANERTGRRPAKPVAPIPVAANGNGRGS